MKVDYLLFILFIRFTQLASLFSFSDLFRLDKKTGLQGKRQEEIDLRLIDGDTIDL